MRKNKDILTVVIPELQREEAVAIRNELLEMKDRVAPGARGGIAIGRHENFASLMDSCMKQIRGGE